MVNADAAAAPTLRTRELIDAGQSPWLDYLRRDLVRSGTLAAMAGEGRLTGVTSNPSIFEKAISGSTLYAAQLERLARRGVTGSYEAFVALAIDDIRGACDALRPVYDATRAGDGYVSLEVPPGVESDTGRIVAEAKRLFQLVERPNLMIKVPGTVEAEAAIEELIAAGVNVNITLLFALSAYERAAFAYIRGLERRYVAGHTVSGIASCASFFVSRVDTAVDALLAPESPLRGQAAVANARAAYARFEEIFSGPRWERLAADGAMVQRPLWASTGTKNAAYSDVLYVETLVAPHTINTMPEATLNAFLDHARVAPMTPDAIASGRATLAALARAGIDLDAVTDRLLDEGLASFQNDFDKLLARIEKELRAERLGRPILSSGSPTLAGDVAARIETWDHEHAVERTWRGDHTVWSDDPTELADRLGWLHVVEEMRAEAPALQEWARDVAAEGFEHVVLLGMGGSSLAPEVMRAVFGVAPGMPDLVVLDATHPVQVREVEAAIDLERTLFVVSSKSGGTIETRSHFDYFWSKLPRGKHFIAITDAGSALERIANERGARSVFLNRPDIGGRYSALSYFGLVPAALIGVDLERLLDRALEMAEACRNPGETNPGSWLGAVLGEAGTGAIVAGGGRSTLAHHDKLTLVLPDALRSLGWWIEQLVAESSGKDGRGILPIEGEPLGAAEVYGADRIFVAIGGHPGLAALERAGHPVVRLPFVDAYQLGAEFFRWEFATAFACQVLGVNPFDQPSVQEAKDNTNAILAGKTVDTATPPLADVLAQVEPGDYVAITAYLPRNAANEAALATARLALRDTLRVPVTTGYGPRFLHSTGQLHKGGPATGVVIQVVPEPGPDGIAIPGQPFTFARLCEAQALGDLASLRAHDRRVARVTLAELLGHTR